jgi:hypothetical protein
MKKLLSTMLVAAMMLTWLLAEAKQSLTQFIQ